VIILIRSRGRAS